MQKPLVNVGDRLESISLPGEDLGRFTHKIGKHVVRITVHDLPGPMGKYLVAKVVFVGEFPDLVAPLHMLQHFEILKS